MYKNIIISVIANIILGFILFKAALYLGSAGGGDPFSKAIGILMLFVLFTGITGLLFGILLGYFRIFWYYAIPAIFLQSIVVALLGAIIMKAPLDIVHIIFAIIPLSSIFFIPSAIIAFTLTKFIVKYIDSKKTVAAVL